MKTLRVLTGFSAPAGYAASYACMLARQLNSRSIVLYHSEQVPVPVSEIALMASDEETTHFASLQHLHDLQLQLKPGLPANIDICQRADNTGLSKINSIAEEEGQS